MSKKINISYRDAIKLTFNQTNIPFWCNVYK